jgi:signal transduction histidine kinase
MRFNYSLTYPIIIILIIVAGFSLGIGYYLNISTLKETIEAREQARAMAITDAVNDKIKTYLSEITAVSQILQKSSPLLDGLVYFQKHGDLGPLKKTMDALYPALSRTHLVFFLVTDQKGKVVYRASHQTSEVDVSGIWGMDEASGGETILSAGFGPLGWSILSLVPLAEGPKQYGVIILGIPLDDSFARSFARATHTQITFGNAYRILASSWPVAAQKHVDLSRVNDSIIGKRSLYFAESQTHLNSFYIPIKIVDETVCLIINIDNTQVAALFQQKERELALSSAGILLLMLAVGWGMTYVMVKPLRRLQQKAFKTIKEFSQEEVSIPRRGTEIATLSQAMELMLVTIGKHLSDLQRVQENLREEKAFFSSVFNSIQDGIAVLDANYTIVQVNPALEQLFPHHLPLVGQKCYAALHGFPSPCADCPSRMAMETGQTAFQLQSFPNPGREATLWVEIYAFPLYKTSGEQASGTIQYIRDVTWRQAAEEALRQRDEQLRQAAKMQAIGTLAGGIAHDFNNILGAIIGFTELTLQSVSRNSQEDYNLQQVLKAGERAKDLVKQILLFSRRTPQERKRLHLSSIVKETIPLLRASLPATISIQTNLAAPAAMVLADPTEIHQILMNLGSNAAHAMREKGGLLEVNLEEIRLDPGDLAPYQGLTPGPYVKLTIRDTGLGMDPAVMGRIFEPFFTTKEVGEGTGMGLAVVHGIVKSSGGEITVSSQPGEGTIVTILLPLVPGEVVDAGPELTATFAAGNNSILFIDDEEMLVNMARQMLKKLGYEVVAQTSSLEALKIFQGQPEKFDLVISDQTMPDMTGMELAQELRRLRPDIPIILCTGYSENVSLEKIKAAGINGLLMKPIFLSKLAETIRKVLD